MKNFITVLIILFILGCKEPKTNYDNQYLQEKTKKEALLIGTFHYNNPGQDIAKTKSFDVLKEKYQIELRKIASKIKEFKPTKIFVEWPYNEQNELDSLYHLYINNQYFNNKNLSNFYQKNEIFQLAFRVAKENNLDRVYGVDYSTSFPFQQVMDEIENSGQTNLKKQIQDIFEWAKKIDTKIESGISLTELTYYTNSNEFREYSNNWHNNLMLLAGNSQNFSGPFLTSEWYKRNLYMWSLIQKNVIEEDQRIMILVGASHAAMIDLFIQNNQNWKVRELEEIMDK